MTERISAFVFDMDGLMVDSEPLAREAWRILLADLGHALDARTVDAMLGLRLADSARLVKDSLRLSIPLEQIMQKRIEIFLNAIAGNVVPMSGLLMLLDAVDERGLRRAVATSSPSQTTPVVLREIGVPSGFDVIVTGDMVRRGKPAPDIYLAVAKALGLAPVECLALEDSPNGISAAKAAGMRCIAVPNASSAGMDLTAADAICSSLGEVAARLDEWLG
jgi:beta-phosphoglucomutase